MRAAMKKGSFTTRISIAVLFFLILTFFLLLWFSPVKAAEICLSEQDASRLALEYERGQICKAEVAEWEQYSFHKEQEIAAKEKLITAYKEQIAKNEKTIQGLKTLALKPTPKFKVLLSPALYIEVRAPGSLSSDLIRGGVKLDVLRAWGMTLYGKAEGGYRDDSRTTGFGVYAGAEWRLW